MKLKIALILLLILPISIIAQEIILEAEDRTDEQKRVTQVKESIRKLEDDYSKSFEQYEKVLNKLNPNAEVSNPTKAKLEKKLQDIEQTQYEMQRQSIEAKCKQINILRTSIGQDYDYCPSLEGMKKRLNESHKEIRNQLAGIRKKQGEEATEKIIYENEVSNLEKEISSLDALLEDSKVEKSKKTKSLDDFLAENGKTKATTSKSKTSNNLDDMLTSSSNKKTAKNNSLDDMLSSSNGNLNSNSLDDLISTSSSDDFKIDSKNGLTGVIDSRGKVLIPYKNWDIVEYKMGIAKVRKKGETKSCNGTYTAYKEGFVDGRGEFIDGFEIDFYYYENPAYRKLVIYANTGRTPAERAANDRSYERRKALERKEKEVERKKCDVEINNWKRSIKAKYQ